MCIVSLTGPIDVSYTDIVLFKILFIPVNARTDHRTFANKHPKKKRAGVSNTSKNNKSNGKWKELKTI